MEKLKQFGMNRRKIITYSDEAASYPYAPSSSLSFKPFRPIHRSILFDPLSGKYDFQ